MAHTRSSTVTGGRGPAARTDFDARVEAAKQEDADRKKAKKARKSEAAAEAGDDDGAEGVDPEMAAMMGFGSFGAGKK